MSGKQGKEVIDLNNLDDSFATQNNNEIEEFTSQKFEELSDKIEKKEKEKKASELPELDKNTYIKNQEKLIQAEVGKELGALREKVELAKLQEGLDKIDPDKFTAEKKGNKLTIKELGGVKFEYDINERLTSSYFEQGQKKWLVISDGQDTIVKIYNDGKNAPRMTSNRVKSNIV